MAGAKGLGRGLDVLLKGIASGMEHPEVLLVKLEEVRPNPRQPRLEFDPQALEDLAASIREQGVLQPVLVRPVGGKEHGYELVAGERRLRASKMAGLSEIPALVREVSDEQSLALALIENLQRENLNALEEAKGLQQLVDAFGLSQEGLAQKVGKSRSAVANSLRLLQLPRHVQESLANDSLSAGHARALLSISDPGAQEELWRRIQSGPLSVRSAEEAAAFWKEHGELPMQDAQARPLQQGRSKRPAASEQEARLAASLRDHFHANVKVGGDANKGRITFSYASPGELQALLRAWGMQDD